MTSTSAIGIDLGTVYSCVGVWRDGRAEILANSMGNHTTPSYVAFTDTERLVGDAAKNQIVSVNPQNTVLDAKRLIGRKFSDPVVQKGISSWPFRVVRGVGDKPLIEVEFKHEIQTFTPEEISGCVLAAMKDTAQASLGPGSAVRQAVIAVPASFNAAQRRATYEAAKIAGLEVLRLIDETSAAAMAYTLGSPALPNRDATDGDRPDGPGERLVLIFDLGAGHLNVSLVAIDDGIIMVRDTRGGSHVGGQQFTDRLVGHFLQEFKRKYGGKDLRDSPRAMCRLRTACEKAKRVLSFSTTATIELDSLHDGVFFTATITRVQFEVLCIDLFRNCPECVADVLKHAGVDKSSVHDVVLVGGSARIPKVQQLLQEHFNGKALCKSFISNEGVACGAAAMAALLTGSDAKLEDRLLIDTTRFGLGIETAGGVMTVAFPRNTTTPAAAELTLSTYKDNQNAVLIKVYEGDRSRAKDNQLLGKLELSGLKEAPGGATRIKVKLDLEASGVLVVFAQEEGTGNSQRITIRPDELHQSAQESPGTEMEGDTRQSLTDDGEGRSNSKVVMVLRDGLAAAETAAAAKVAAAEAAAANAAAMKAAAETAAAAAAAADEAAEAAATRAAAAKALAAHAAVEAAEAAKAAKAAEEEAAAAEQAAEAAASWRRRTGPRDVAAAATPAAAVATPPAGSSTGVLAAPGGDDHDLNAAPWATAQAAPGARVQMRKAGPGSPEPKAKRLRTEQVVDAAGDQHPEHTQAAAVSQRDEAEFEAQAKLAHATLQQP